MQNNISNWQQPSYVYFMAQVKPDQKVIRLSPINHDTYVSWNRFPQGTARKGGSLKRLMEMLGF